MTTTTRDMLNRSSAPYLKTNPDLTSTTIVIEGTPEILTAMTILRNAMIDGAVHAKSIRKHNESRIEILRKSARGETGVDREKPTHFLIEPNKMRDVKDDLLQLEKDDDQLIKRHEAIVERLEDVLFGEELVLHQLGSDLLGDEYVGAVRGLISFIVTEPTGLTLVGKDRSQDDAV